MGQGMAVRNQTGLPCRPQNRHEYTGGGIRLGESTVDHMVLKSREALPKLHGFFILTATKERP